MKEKGKIIGEIKKESKAFAFSPVSKNLARMGYGARGLIYGVMGFLAIKVAFGIGRLQDQEGAIATIGQSLIGKILLGIILIGLVGYVLWDLIRAFFDPLHRGKSLKGLWERVGYFVSAIAYAILIPPTYGFIFGSANAAQNGSQVIQLRNIISTIFLIPLGRWIVGIIGLVVLMIGFFQIYQGLRHDFDKQIKPYALTARQIKIIKLFGRFGTLARAVVYALIGLFLLFSAYQASSLNVKGIDGALLVILQQPYGAWLLGIVAAGLIAFGAYSLLSAFWFKFKKVEA